MFLRVPLIKDENFNPEDYGFRVTKMPPVTREEMAAFYDRVKENTGIDIPEAEKNLGAYALSQTVEQTDATA